MTHRPGGARVCAGAIARLTCLGLLAFAVASAPGTSSAQTATQPARRTLHVEPSAFSAVVVYETEKERCMTFRWADNPNAETCYLLADPDRVAFDYVRMMVSALLVQPEPQRILVIGAGGGTLGRTFAALLPNAQVDNVDVDPAVIRVAEAYFGLQVSRQLRVHVADGREFIEQAIHDGHRYDLVMLDAFDETYIPPHLITHEFLLRVRDVLAERGVVVANTAGRSGLGQRELATYASVFGDLFEFPAHNRIIMATPGSLPPNETLRMNERQWRARLEIMGIDTDIFFQRLTRVQAGPGQDASEVSSRLTDANAGRALSSMQISNGVPTSP